MATLLYKLVADRRAQDLAEYGICLAVIGLGAAVAALALSADVAAIWSNAASILTAAAT